MITQPSNLLRLLWVSHSSELFSCYISSLHSHSATLISDDVFQMMMFPFPFHLHWALQEVVWTLWNCDVVVGFRFVDFLWMLPFKAARLMPLQLIVQLKGHQSDLPPLQMIPCQYYPTHILCTIGYFLPVEMVEVRCTNIYSAVFDAVQLKLHNSNQEILLVAVLNFLEGGND